MPCSQQSACRMSHTTHAGTYYLYIHIYAKPAWWRYEQDRHEHRYWQSTRHIVKPCPTTSRHHITCVHCLYYNDRKLHRNVETFQSSNLAIVLCKFLASGVSDHCKAANKSCRNLSNDIAYLKHNYNVCVLSAHNQCLSARTLWV